MLDAEEPDIAVEARATAEDVGLAYVDDGGPGIRRRRSGKGFRYLRPDGTTLKDKAAIERIQRLVVPPAWTDVWICPRANGHIQATGRDAKGRKQYRYHSRFREARESNKYEHMLAFAKSLPAIRAGIDEHLRLRTLCREKVLASVVYLLETTLVRVGNDEYARQNNSYGLATLKNRHVEIDGPELRFSFKGKSGKMWRLNLRDRRIAKVIRACHDLPGQELFQYIDENGEIRDVTSSDVNDYLREISGRHITAKDFRTWHGTVLAAMALQELEMVDTKAATKRNVREAIQRVAERLGNTPTICKKCYVHPEIFAMHAEGALLLDVKREIDEELRDELSGLQPEEAAVLVMLRNRLGRTLKDKLEASIAAAN